MLLFLFSLGFLRGFKGPERLQFQTPLAQTGPPVHLHNDLVEIHREYGEIPRIRGYSGKLSQVFMNLLSNAFHAIADKGDVWIRTSADDHVVQVEIEDNGHGIPRENLKRIFEPFFTTKAVGQGTGLGLSISYGIIEQHHGKIFVANAAGGGAIFTLRLPILQENANP